VAHETAVTPVLRQGTKARQFSTPKWVDAIIFAMVAFAWNGFLIGVVPMAWGWNFHCLTTGRGAWSMASDDRAALMPLSVYYTARQSSYKAGDVVSFDYQENADPTENGPTVKLAESVDGSTFRFRPLNLKCSNAAGTAGVGSIKGKVVVKQSLLPRGYWRWLSLGWTLTVDQMSTRERRVFSCETVASLFSRRGWLRNRVAFRYPPSALKARWGCGYVLESDAVRVVVPGSTIFVSDPGYQFASLQGDTLVVSKKEEASRVEVDLATGREVKVKAPRLKLPARVKARVYRNEHGLSIPLLSVPYDLPSQIAVRVGDVTRIVTPFHLPSSEAWGGEPVCSFGGLFPALSGVNSGEMIEIEISEVEEQQIAASGRGI